MVGYSFGLRVDPHTLVWFGILYCDRDAARPPTDKRRDLKTGRLTVPERSTSMRTRPRGDRRSCNRWASARRWVTDHSRSLEPMVKD